MKATKKFLAIFLSVVMMFSMLSSSAFAGAEGPIPAEETETIDIMDPCDTAKYLIDIIHNLVGTIMGFFGQDCAFCGKLHTCQPDAPEEPEEPEVIDKDDDGVSADVENLLGLSDASTDSDNDGIDDYVEIYEIGSDPSDDDSNDDLDYDGISNIDEINTHKTSPAKADTDNDGLNDYVEVFESKTDPLEVDTDGDNVSDGKEIELGTNPLVSEKSFELTVTCEESDDSVTPSVEMELDGNQVETLTIEEVEDDTMFNETMPGYMGNAYEFNVDGDFDSAKIGFEFDPSMLTAESDPTIYYFNEETQELEPLETTIDGNIATAEVEHFSKYILIDRKVYEESFSWTDIWDSTKSYTDVEIVLVIDDSGSLGGDYGYDSDEGVFTGGKDPKHLRLEVARNFIDNSNTNAKIGIVKFDGVIDNISGDLVECTPEGKEALKEHLKFTYANDYSEYNVHGIFDSRGYTQMYEGIQEASTQFSEGSDSTMKVVIVFTDGEAHDTELHSDVIAEAVANDIKIYTVGLGTSSWYFDEYLMPLASNTGGAFYLASDAEELSDIYENISEKIDIESDSDADGIPDYYEDNMVLFSGVEIALDKNNPDTDGDGLKDGEEIELKYEYNADNTQVKVTGKYILGNPILPDTDYDGINDNEDDLPLENLFTGSLRMSEFSPRIKYIFDYRNFFADNTLYNARLAETSLIFSSVMYENGNLNYDNRYGLADTKENEIIADYHMDDVVNYKLKDGYDDSGLVLPAYNDDDISEVIFGHKKVAYNGETKEIVSVLVRGTNGTIEEWSSNFDLGNLNEFDSIADWSNSKHHKGFDVAATRIMKALTQYKNRFVHSDATYWVTGHSRGAAIANIISANLVDAGNEVFAYTFATPNTTIDVNSHASKYNCIFNCLNENDFVTTVPMAAWNFSRYGRSTNNVSISGQIEKQWKTFTGEGYNPIAQKTLDKLVAELAACSNNGWASCHTLTCDCHGDNTDNSIIEKGVEPFVYENIIRQTRPGQYCKASLYTRPVIGQEQYQLCQTPAYFMQVLAEIMVDQYDMGLGGKAEQLTEIVAVYSLADKYEKARNQVVIAAIKGIEHQHYTESYYLLTQYVDASSFI